MPDEDFVRSSVGVEFCVSLPALLGFLLQVIINSTITPNMTFTKTSQKFGQWADSRANTVFGLGFSSEQQLTKVTRSPRPDTVTQSLGAEGLSGPAGEQDSSSAFDFTLAGPAGLPNQMDDLLEIPGPWK